MVFKAYFQTLGCLLAMLVALTACCTSFAWNRNWVWAAVCAAGIAAALFFLYRIYSRNARKIDFMFAAVDNDDYTFKFPESTLSASDNLVSRTLNRTKDLLFRAKAEAVEKEKYYEIILNRVDTGILVANARGAVIQTNNEARRLLGLTVFTHLTQLKKIDDSLPDLFFRIKNGEKRHLSFTNERESVHLSVHASEMHLGNDRLRIFALNDIRRELDEKEIDSWLRLIRVLTHEIMNSVTPITSISDTLQELYAGSHPGIRHGLETISATGKNLVSFVESYRKLTHIPTPQPNLFYVGRWIARMTELAAGGGRYPLISIETDVRPHDLLLYADESLVSQVMLNLLKNAMQAIGPEAPGRITVKAGCCAGEEVVIEVGNDGPQIPKEIAEQLFIPFFTTKENGSGIGLSISRQIMRLSGGNLTLKTDPAAGWTAFILTFS